MTIALKKALFIIITISLAASCKSKRSEDVANPLGENLPGQFSIPFKPELTSDGMIMHGGSFSPGLKTYLYTVSDAQYARFDVLTIERVGNQWSEPENAFFNSEFSEHGAKFSPDGKTLYFSSTRPTGIAGIPDTWHIWKSERQNGGWSEPEFIDIPNLRDKLVSHPSITRSGTLYFHVSNLDYSEMTLYVSQWSDGKFGEARKLNITENSLACTPFVSADGQTLIYAAIGNQLDLMISHKTAEGEWGKPVSPDKSINTNGQGNPYLTPDGKYLFYTTGTEVQAGQNPDWQIKWVSTKLLLK